MFSLVEEHARYVGDRSRMSAYQRAIGKTVRPGSVVLDLGSGTAVLGILACQAGAARVYCVDRSEMVEVARRVVRDSAYQDRIQILHADSRDVVLPERANVVIADQMGAFGLGAGLVECFADARARLLDEHAAYVPRKLTLMMAVASAPEVYRSVSVWQDEREGVDLSAMRRIASSAQRFITVEQCNILGEPGPFQVIELSSARPTPLAASLRFAPQEPATLHGLVGWFEAELAEGVTLSNDPRSAERIDRELLFLPFEQPLVVSPGDSVGVRLQIDSTETLMAWRTQHESARGPTARFEQSTLRTHLLTSADVQRTAPDHRPRLSPRAEAARFVLASCDGSATLSEIAAEVQRRFSGRFATLEQAERFVTKVVHEASR